MKIKLFFFLAFAIFNINAFSQITFQKGYFINNDNEKIDCLIKNVDWFNNFVSFQYKLSEESEPSSIDLISVKEFEIYNNSKYIRKTVKIDKSNDNVNNLSYDKNPHFVEETVFLKVLVEGKSNLFLYENMGKQSFFFNKDNSNIEQLVYKSYLISNTLIGKNIYFKQQLWNELKCESIIKNNVERLEYKTKNLLNFFVEYNKCSNADYINYEGKVKKDLFNLTLRTHLKSSSLILETIFNNQNITFNSQSGFGIGVEAEFILPFNKNKWGILIEPTYQSFKSEKISDVNYLLGEKQITVVDYSSIESPVSLRHFMFINNNSKFFATVSYIFDFRINSTIDLRRYDNSTYNLLEISARDNLGFGVGYKYRDKYSVEIKYQTSRDLLGYYSNVKTKYNTISVIFGYTIF